MTPKNALFCLASTFISLCLTTTVLAQEATPPATDYPLAETEQLLEDHATLENAALPSSVLSLEQEQATESQAETFQLATQIAYRKSITISPEWSQLFTQLRTLANGDNQIALKNAEARQLVVALDALSRSEVKRNIPNYFDSVSTQEIVASATKYNVNNLPPHLLQNLNQYFISLVNSIHQQLGDGKTGFINKNYIHFAEQVALKHQQSGIPYTFGHNTAIINSVASSLGFRAQDGMNFYENKGLLTNYSGSHYYGFARESLTEPELYDTVYQFTLGLFLLDGGGNGYGHALSLIETDTFGLDFHFLSNVLQMHILSGKETLYQPYRDEIATKYKEMIAKRNQLKATAQSEANAGFAKVKEKRTPIQEKVTQLEAEKQSLVGANNVISNRTRYLAIEQELQTLKQSLDSIHQEFLAVQAKQQQTLAAAKQLETDFNAYSRDRVEQGKQAYQTTYGVASSATIRTTFTPPAKLSVIKKKTPPSKSAQPKPSTPANSATKPSNKQTKPSTTKPTPKNQTSPTYRLYHPGIQRHLYTQNLTEANILKGRGWNFEGEKFRTATSGKPVYRLYHEGTREHIYTTDTNEENVLPSRGWRYEGVAWHSSGKRPVYRLYHQGLKVHLYTSDTNEKNVLSKRGWTYEGISFYTL